MPPLSAAVADSSQWSERVQGLGQGCPGLCICINGTPAFPPGKAQGATLALNGVM